jgi:glycosyltransferase involved in cell wall biosynthesis
VRVAFFVREVIPEGGVALATFRLATALSELGHDSQVLYCSGDPPQELRGLGRRIEGDPRAEAAPAGLRQSLERFDPTVVVVGSGRSQDMVEAIEVAPTLLHAHLHMGTCPDLARHWSRLGRPCGVRAGWRCAALRPLLGCSELKRAVRPGPIQAQRALLRLLSSGEAGVLCVSTDQAEVYLDHGVARSRIAVVPNLGIRATASELAEASAKTPEAWRSATAFVGRLSKPKGAALLDELARVLPAEARLRVFGDGYLAEALSSLPDGVRCGHVAQDRVAGVLMWARSVLFPSIWPEPGGIVGIDAQVMGVPLAAFEVGAPRHWPGAQRFELGGLGEMADWLAAQPPRAEPRNPDAVSQTQARYWRQVTAHAADAIAAFAQAGRFGDDDGDPVEALMRGPEPEAARAGAGSR